MHLFQCQLKKHFDSELALQQWLFRIIKTNEEFLLDVLRDKYSSNKYSSISSIRNNFFKHQKYTMFLALQQKNELLIQFCQNIYINTMHNLRLALSQEELPVSPFQTSISKSGHGKPNNVSSSIWSIEAQIDNDSFENQPESEEVIVYLLTVLDQERKNCHIPNQDMVEEILQGIDEYVQEAEEKDGLVFLERKLLLVLAKASLELERYIHKFLEAVKAKKRKLKSKDVNRRKKVREFDQIQERLFKKPSDENKKVHRRNYVEIKQEDEQFKRKRKSKSSKKHESNGTKNSGDSQDSGSGKLTRLLTGQQPDNKNPQTLKNAHSQQSYSFSHVMSASATVRQRTNKPKKDKKIDVAYMNNFDDADTIDHKPADEAFIFFRPKKSKK